MIVRLARWAARARADSDLTSTQTMVLATIARRGPLGPSDLARAEGLNPTMLSRILRRLEEEGLVTRLADPTDRRAVLIEATASGSELNDRIRAARSKELSAVLERLSPEDRAALSGALPILEVLSDELKTWHQ